MPKKCKKCGCTFSNPCYNPKVGFCWWVDASETLCSHCADESIRDDKDTVHRVCDIPDWKEPEEAKNKRLAREIEESFAKIDVMQASLELMRTLRIGVQE
ncbi:MAG: hypothetical protein IJP62_03300 [Treponema sp.]|nr:hypothetical protein [Treponema sp.]